MNKRLFVTSFSTCMLIATTSYNQTSNSKDTLSQEQDTTLHYKEHRTSTDTTLTKLRLTTTKANRYSRYKYLQKEKDRRKKIREKYKKEKQSNS